MIPAWERAGSTESDITQLIGTKLYPLRVTGHRVLRPRLRERQEDRGNRPLTLVSAPAGNGKTTLVINWLETCDCPSAWASLDEETNDLVLFLTRLLAAVETTFPGAVTDTQALLRTASLPPLPVLARSLINGLNQIEPSLIIVLDDYHIINSTVVHSLIEELLAHPPRLMLPVLILSPDLSGCQPQVSHPPLIPHLLPCRFAHPSPLFRA